MKNVVYCADGTWCHPSEADAAASETDSNVYKLFKALPVTATQLPRYDDGIGAEGNFFRRLFDGAFGEGLFKKIKEGYTTIAHDYVDGDRIFLFGFSRGAYTARSIAGMIACTGLPTGGSFPQSAIEDAFAAYRCKPQSPERAAATQSLKSKYGNRQVPIEMIGVWDTVGSLGIPSLIGGIDTHRYGFLDTHLSSSVRGAYQALAIDERRREFPPTLWDDATVPGQTLEQVWFSGCHGNVGGGCPKTNLSDLPLKWMISKGLSHGLEVGQDMLDKMEAVSTACALEAIDESWKPLWGLPSWRQVPPSAALSQSVLARIQGLPIYSPANLTLSGRVLGTGYRVVPI